MLILWSYLKNLPAPIAALVGLAGAVLILWAIGGILYVKEHGWSRFRKYSQSGLCFVEWFNGTTIGCSRFCGELANLIEVRNATLKIPVPAKEVTASIHFESSAGAKLDVHNAAWWEVKHNGPRDLSGWKSSIDRMDAGENQYFVLFTQDDSGQYWAVKDNGTKVGLIDYGEWIFIVQVTSLNVEGFELTISFTRARGGSPEGPRVPKRRGLPPRMPQA